MSYLKRRESSLSQVSGSGSCAVSADDCQKFPALVEFLTAATWPDGASRVTGTLLLFVEEGKVKLCLNDRDQGMVQFSTATSLQGALEAAEGVLEGGNGDWRASKRSRR